MYITFAKHATLPREGRNKVSDLRRRVMQSPKWHHDISTVDIAPTTTRPSLHKIRSHPGRWMETAGGRVVAQGREVNVGRGRVKRVFLASWDLRGVFDGVA